MMTKYGVWRQISKSMTISLPEQDGFIGRLAVDEESLPSIFRILCSMLRYTTIF